MQSYFFYVYIKYDSVELGTYSKPNKRNSTKNEFMRYVCFIIFYFIHICMGSRDDAVVRALASHRFDSKTQRHMWVEFVVGSFLCSERFFSGYYGFPLSSIIAWKVSPISAKALDTFDTHIKVIIIIIIIPRPALF